MKTNPKFNNGNMDPTSYEHNRGLIYQTAGKAYRRIVAAGLDMDFEDVVQELNVAWLRACECYDKDTGNNFSTYLVRVMYNHINKVIEKEERHTNDIGISKSMSFTTEEGEFNLEDILPADTQSPEENLSAADSIEDFLSSLSDDAKLVVDLLTNRSPELEHELACVQAKAELAREKFGELRRAPTQVELHFVLNYLKTLRGEGVRYVRELRSEITDHASMLLG